MKRYCFGILLASAALTQTHAQGLNGFYVGLGAGAHISKTDSYITEGTDLNPIYAKGHFHTNNANGAIFAGYGQLINNCFYVGLEGQIDFNNSKSHDVYKDQQYKIRIKQHGSNYAFLGRVGAAITKKTMIYAGLGGRSLKTSYNVPSIDTSIIPSTGQYDIPYHVSKRPFRLYAEIGTEGLFGNTECFGWRFNYGYTDGKTTHGHAFPVNHQFQGANTGTSSSRFKSINHTVRAALTFRF